MANPKNPVRAARQASRQAIRTAKTVRRQDNRTAKTEKKVGNIAARTATKVAKIQGRSGTPAAATTPAPKFKTAAELKSTIKMPDFKARAVEMAKEKAKANGTGSKAPVTKSTPKVKKEAPKATPAPAPAKTGPYVVSKEYDKAVLTAKENAQGSYITLADKRNPDQKIQVKIDKKKQTRKMLESLMPNRKAGGPVKKYQMGGTAKPKAMYGTSMKPSMMKKGGMIKLKK